MVYLNDHQHSMGYDSAFSAECQSGNIDSHGFCDGTANDGEPCYCDYCKHPSAQPLRDRIRRLTIEGNGS